MKKAKSDAKNNLAACMYEMIGTALIMYAFMVEEGKLYPLATTLVMMMAAWNISGGHFNPAITLSQYIAKMRLAKELIPTVLIIVAQFLGGFLGILLGYFALISSSY